MGKIRINDLARELEVKSKSILDVLPEVGVTEKKSHSSSLEDHEADKVRARLRAASAAPSSSRSSRPGASRWRRDQDQDRPLQYFQARRRSQSDHQQTTGHRDAAMRPHRCGATCEARSNSRTTCCGSSCKGSNCHAAGCSTGRAAKISSSDHNSEADLYSAGPASTSSGRSSGCSIGSGCARGRPFRRSRRRPAASSTRWQFLRGRQPRRLNRRLWLLGQLHPSAPAPPSAPLPRMIVPQTGPRPVYKAPLRPAAACRSSWSARGRHHASGSGTSGAGPADFPAPASRRAYKPSAVAAGRAPSDASHAPVAHGLASVGRWTGSSAFGRANTPSG